MVSAWNLKKGIVIKYRDTLYQVVEHYISAQQQRKAAVQVKLRNLETGAIIEERFLSTDELERAILEKRSMEYLYRDMDHHVFMDLESYDQVYLNAEQVSEAIHFLLPNMQVELEMYEGKMISFLPPNVVSLKVMETEPGLKGATVTNVRKPATLETGVVVQVPPFVEVGDMIRVDTRDGKYIERA